MSSHDGEQMDEYGSLDAWSRRLGIPVNVLRERLAGVTGLTGKLHDGSVLVDGFYVESEVRRTCADLIAD